MDNQTWLSLQSAAEQFLQSTHIAVIGISRSDDDTAILIYNKLKQCGHQVYAVHPYETEVKGIRCFPSLAELPESVQAAVVVTQPKHLQGIVMQAIAADLQWLWVHKSFGNSVDAAAVSIARKGGINVIDGACPMMFLQPVDGAHKCLKVVMSALGRIPKRIPVLELDTCTQ